MVHADRRAMNPHAGSSKWHNSYLIDHNTHMHFNMTRIVEMVHRADSPGFISLLDVGTFYQCELPLVDVEGRTGGKGTLLPFLSVSPIFSISCLMRESNGTKNERDGVSRLVVCHRMPLPFFAAFEESSGLMASLPSPSCQWPCWFVVDALHLLVLALCLVDRTPMHQGHRNSVLTGHPEHSMQIGHQQTSNYMYLLCSCECFVVALDLTYKAQVQR